MFIVADFVSLRNMHKAPLEVNLHTVTDLSEHSLEAYEIRTKISHAGSIGSDKEKFSA